MRTAECQPINRLVSELTFLVASQLMLRLYVVCDSDRKGVVMMWLSIGFFVLGCGFLLFTSVTFLFSVQKRVDRVFLPQFFRMSTAFLLASIAAHLLAKS